MSAEENNVTNAGAESVQDTTQSSKGKGKAPVANHSEEDHSMAMEDDEESSSDEEPVSGCMTGLLVPATC